VTIIKIRRKYYNIPTDWNELTADQLLQVMDVFSNKNYAPEQTLLKLLKILLSMSYRKWFTLKAEDVEEYIYLVGFIFFETNYLTKQLIPMHNGFYGPSDEIGNMVMKEFVFSEHFFMQWQDDKENLDLLHSFIATIYRRSKPNYNFYWNPDGDPRTEFNENICEWNAKHFIAGWPLNIKQAIAHWYGSCRLKLVDDNPEVFGGTGEPAKHGLISIIRDVAKNGAYGKFDEVENIPVNLMMIELNEVVEEGKKLEQEMKK